jgi:uroporphyrin-III C-methyltransferase
MLQDQRNSAKVILAGAGPGDPDLITVKAARYLQKAEVVLTDRLVSAEILETYLNKEAEIVYVGKQCGKGTSTKQSTINELLVEYALQGKFVVRLKGGDISFFSNVLDELQVLTANNIPYEIIPGITAAAGASAYAGIPLTARNFSAGVRFLTYYKQDVYPETYWKELAQTDDTLVFYMSSETLGMLVARLTENNISGDKLLAVVEQATTPFQHVHTCNLYEYAEKLRQVSFLSPSLVIIGKVVGLHQSFGWMENSDSREYYFNPIAKLSTVLTDNTDKVKHYVDRA